MSELRALLVTSAGAPPVAVVPVLAALEAAGLRVRAIDVGGAGGGGVGVADRVRRALLGEGAERRLRRELEASPPDVAIAFDPDAALALTVARDQVPAPAPVVAVVGALAPAEAWAQTDADRFLAIDDHAAVALADAGVEGDRILVVGAFGERAFAEAAGQERAALRARFGLRGRVALVEVAGLGPEVTGGLALQLSLLDAGEAGGGVTFLFDAAGDADAAAVLRRQVPALGLRGKLFGATPDAPLLWRAAEVIVARPRPETVARALLLGAPLVALVDDEVPDGAAVVAALELRRRAHAARGLLLLSGALAAAFAAPPPAALDDAAEHAADVLAAIAADRRAVVEERRAARLAETRERVRAVNAASAAAARREAMPGALEDLGGDASDAAPPPPADQGELGRLRGEVRRRLDEQRAAMMTARGEADALAAQAAQAAAGGDAATAAERERQAEVARARMHALLGELATLEAEARELEQAIEASRAAGGGRRAADAARPTGAPGTPPRGSGGGRGAPASVDDALEALKRRAATGAPAAAPGAPPRSGPRPAARSGTVEDELEALKRRMATQPPRKKP